MENEKNKNFIKEFGMKTYNDLLTYLGFFKEDNTTPTPTFFEVAKTSDGIVVGTEVEAPFAIGDTLLVVGSDGTPAPATEGSYTLEDGRVIVCDANGIITEIQTPGGEAQPAAPAEQSSETQPTATAPQPKEITITKIEKQSFEAENAIKILVEKLEELSNKFAELEIKSATEKEEFEKQIVELSGQPASKPIVRTSESSSATGLKKVNGVSEEDVKLYAKYYS